MPNFFSASAELALLRRLCADLGVPFVVARHWAEGGAGAEELAHAVVGLADSGTAKMRFVYEDDLPLVMKIEAVAKRVYGAVGIKVDSKALARLDELEREGELHTELSDGRKFNLTPGVSYQVADNAEAHRSFTNTGAKLFIVD